MSDEAQEGKEVVVSKGRGRKPISEQGNCNVACFTLTPEIQAGLDEDAKAENKKKAVVVREALAEYHRLRIAKIASEVAV
jgi:hypothetical protein